MTATVALLNRPCERLAECEVSFIEREPIDIERARVQHEGYAEALRALGVEVVCHEVNRDAPDGVFVEDVALVLDECAVMLPMGTAARRDEVDAVAGLLAPYRVLEWIEPPARLEGGDILCLGRTLYVGASTRTDPDGIAALAQVVEPLGYHVEPVPVFGCLHLKTGVTALDEATVVINPDWVDDAAFAGLRRLRVDPNEPWAANTLTVGGTTLVQAGCAQTQRVLERAGFATQAVAIGEFARAEAGLTCLSLVIPPAEPR